MKIITNHKWRDFIYGYELSESERSDFDYIDDIECHDFIRYRGIVYDPSEFMPTPDNTTIRLEHPEFCDWHGFQSDSFFSGVVIRYSDDCEQYQIGLYLS